eukprot:gene13265-18586_t
MSASPCPSPAGDDGGDGDVTLVSSQDVDVKGRGTVRTHTLAPRGQCAKRFQAMFLREYLGL